MQEQINIQQYIFFSNKNKSQNYRYGSTKHVYKAISGV